MLRNELQLKLKLNLNLLLKNQVEVLLYSVQELEQLLKEEKESNPFIEDIYVSDRAVRFYEESRSPEAVYKVHPLELLQKNLRAELEGIDLRIALELISDVDGRGFYRGDTAEVAQKFGVSEDYVEDLREFVMGLEPLGVCSRDFQEFARLQIRELYPEEEAQLSKELEKALKGEKISEESRRKLAHLKSSPIEEGSPPLKVAKVDAIIELDDGELVGYLYEDLIDIRPNTTYLQMLKRVKGEAKEFLRDYVERYENFRKILSVRRENLRRIIDEVIEVQGQFLRGEGNLKALMVKDVAAKLGISESTVSRLINSKYVKTPQGTYPLRFFFVRETAGGISQEELMKEIRELINGEDKRKPLSDDEIAKILRSKGYKVARRTVAKYREMLGIPSSRERKER